jgi:hypothetical protein
MLTNRNHPAGARVRVCPHCGQALAGALVHIEGLTFLCERCLHEIHAEPRQRRRLSLLRGRGRGEPAGR